MNQSKELLGRHLTWSMPKKRVSKLNTKISYMDFVGAESIEAQYYTILEVNGEERFVGTREETLQLVTSPVGR
jgi:hypothetical protein